VHAGTTDPHPTLAAAVSAACHRAGVLTLTCGTWGNVLRFLPPLVIGPVLRAEAPDVHDEVFAAEAPAD
jgi:4-aminobutyrate aminotransferase/(S)-3-amino-2-methylpropionate transaminase